MMRKAGAISIRAGICRGRPMRWGTGLSQSPGQAMRGNGRRASPVSVLADGGIRPGHALTPRRCSEIPSSSALSQRAGSLYRASHRLAGHCWLPGRKAHIGVELRKLDPQASATTLADLTVRSQLQRYDGIDGLRAE